MLFGTMGLLAEPGVGRVARRVTVVAAATETAENDSTIKTLKNCRTILFKRPMADLLTC
jgi:hypothetical protein